MLFGLTYCREHGAAVEYRVQVIPLWFALVVVQKRFVPPDEILRFRERRIVPCAVSHYLQQHEHRT